MFSKSCEYGIRAAIFIAGEALNDNKCGIKDIAKQINAPEAFTAKILQKLVKHNVISSSKGPSGGFYILKQNLEDVTLGDIVFAIEENSKYEGCALGLSECSEEFPCPAHFKFKSIRNELKKVMQCTSLKELASGVHLGITFLNK